MSKDSSAKYYQKNKKRLVKGIKIFLKERKTKSNNMIENNVKMLVEYRE